MKLTKPFVLLSLLTPSIVNGEEIKVAVLDNLQSQKLASEKYQKSYFTGLDLANAYGKEKNITLIIKHFEYGKGDLDILQKVEETKKWSPDIIIGPRSSGKFLLLKEAFKELMVISPLASSNDISNMGLNFYSITPDNNATSKVMSKFVSLKLKKKKIYAFTELDCKSCVDFSDSIAKGTNLTIVNRRMLSSEIESISAKILTKEISTDDPILLSATSYGAALLLSKISNELKNQVKTFLGTDEWGSFKSSYVGKLHQHGNFNAYRIVPWSLNISSDTMKTFKEQVSAADHPEFDEISFVLFSLGKSIVDVVHSSRDRNASVKSKILTGFQSRIKRDPLFSKPRKYTVFRRSKDKEEFEMELE